MLDDNPDGIGIWKCWFLRRAENWCTRRKTSRSKDENQHMAPSPGIESGPHWWEASALTTAPSLLPQLYSVALNSFESSHFMTIPRNLNSTVEFYTEKIHNLVDA